MKFGRFLSSCMVVSLSYYRVIWKFGKMGVKSDFFCFFSEAVVFNLLGNFYFNDDYVNVLLLLSENGIIYREINY